MQLPDDFEGIREAEALRFWDGHGAVRLLAHDPERKALLLERCVPGTPLGTDYDQEALGVAARLMERLWREPPPEVDWPRLDDVAARWTRELPQRYPGRLAEEALDAIAVLTPIEDAVLCHQDLHGGNILRAEREPWLAIDPKPIVAERAYDTVAIVRDANADARRVAAAAGRALRAARPRPRADAPVGARQVARLGQSGRGAALLRGRVYVMIGAEDALRSLLGEPSGLVQSKIADRLNDLTRQFIERSPFLCLATSAADGSCDVSPKGDPAGFVRILDDRTLLLPDRPGNRLADSLRNVLENPHVALLFVIPGVTDTFRVNGRAEIVTDPELLELCAVEGKAPKLAMRIEIEQAYTHCSKAFLRSNLWDPERFVDRSELPSPGELLRSVNPEVEPETYDAERDERYARREGFY